MFVGKRMTRKVVTVSREDTLRHASHLMHQHRIHQLPVVEGDVLTGFVSGTDIRNSTFEETTVSETGQILVKNKTIGEVMTRDVITVTPSDTVEDALALILKRRLGALPVVDGQKLVGIITKADVLSAFRDILRIEEPGVRIEVLLPKGEMSLIPLVRKLSEMDVEIRSLVLTPAESGFIAFLRISTIDGGGVRRVLRDAGFTVPDVADFLQ